MTLRDPAVIAAVAALAGDITSARLVDARIFPAKDAQEYCRRAVAVGWLAPVSRGVYARTARFGGEASVKTEAKLEPVKATECPLCGPVGNLVIVDLTGRFQVRCEMCGIAGPRSEKRTPAINLWDELNRRRGKVWV